MALTKMILKQFLVIDWIVIGAFLIHFPMVFRSFLDCFGTFSYRFSRVFGVVIVAMFLFFVVIDRSSKTAKTVIFRF